MCIVKKKNNIIIIENKHSYAKNVLDIDNLFTKAVFE